MHNDRQHSGSAADGAAAAHRAAAGLIAPRRDRSTLQALLETRGAIGDHQRPHRVIQLLAADGTRLEASYLPGPSASAPAVVLGHGFGAHRRKPAYAYLADVLSGFAHVLSLDFRGHGRSGGSSTLGDREALDVEAGARWLRREGHGHVVAVGVSMGGTAVLHAASDGLDADALVAVSAPAWLHDEPRTEPMREMRSWWVSPWRRWLMATVTNIHVVGPQAWIKPPHPVDAAAKVDCPLLVVHAEDDHFFPFADAEAIAEAGGGVLWREPAGFGHAEDGITPGFAVALGRAIVVVASEGVFPPREEVIAFELGQGKAR